MIELSILALTKSKSSEGDFTLILKEQNGLRKLPIIIGTFEAQAIAVSLQNIHPNYPLTHDLFKNTLDFAGVKVMEVLIIELLDNVFQASLKCIHADGSAFNVKARSSDAIALAVRYGCPIFTTNAVMEAAGIIAGSHSTSLNNRKSKLSEYTRKELEQLLTQVLINEDYETASKIRDILRNRHA